ncbi:hypothetical protein C163_25900 [Pseudomonas sp. FGI182]|nr:hypothetical protein C163_25900 [Pseudomonas sp. FGI182]
MIEPELTALHHLSAYIGLKAQRASRRVLQPDQ